MSGIYFSAYFLSVQELPENGSKIGDFYSLQKCSFFVPKIVHFLYILVQKIILQMYRFVLLKLYRGTLCKKCTKWYTKWTVVYKCTLCTKAVPNLYNGTKSKKMSNFCTSWDSGHFAYLEKLVILTRIFTLPLLRSFVATAAAILEMIDFHSVVTCYMHRLLFLLLLILNVLLTHFSSFLVLSKIETATAFFKPLESKAAAFSSIFLCTAHTGQITFILCKNSKLPKNHEILDFCPKICMNQKKNFSTSVQASMRRRAPPV